MYRRQAINLQNKDSSLLETYATRTYQVDVLVRLQDAPPLPLRLLAPVVMAPAVLSEQAGMVVMVAMGRLLTGVGLLHQDEPLGALLLVTAGLVQGRGDHVGAAARLGDL